MKLTPDTNILVRAAVVDDVGQSAAAQRLLSEAELIALPTSVLCEFVWVMRSTYKRPASDVARSVASLVAASKVEVNRAALAAGLHSLDSGGDFADAVIAFEGAQLGGETFATFDKKAAKLIQRTGQSVVLLK